MELKNVRLRVLALFGALFMSSGSCRRASRKLSLGWDPHWPSIPTGGIRPHGDIGDIRKAYAFAERYPQITRFLPCYCGCQRQGHTSLHDRYVKGHDRQGGPIWDLMGYM